MLSPYAPPLALLVILQVKFQAIAPFKDTTEAVVAATAIVESKLDKGLQVPCALLPRRPPALPCL